MFVRTASERDLPAASRLIADAMHATGDEIYGPQAVDLIARTLYSVAALKALIHRPTSEFLVADDGEAIAGVAIAAAALEDARVVDVLAFFVRPSLQGMGIGGLLLQELEESFFESERIRVEIDERNQRAQSFLTGEGYVPAGQRRDETLAATMVTFDKPLA